MVSIIIPTLNRASLISETLDSILSQTYTNWECIVVDDGSTDATETVVSTYIKKDNRISYYKRPDTKPKGANACRNYGFELSKGAFINWFDSDDLMHPDKLKIQVDALYRSNHSFSVCQTMKFKGTIENQLGLLCDNLLSANPFEDFLTKKIIWLTQAPLLKKEFLITNDYSFDEELQAGQEWELFTRILFNHSDYHITDKSLVYLRKHKNSISGDKTIVEKWYYTLARFKIYRCYKGSLSSNSKFYLRNYFLRMFHEFLREHHIQKAFFVWKEFILMEKSFTYNQKIKMLIALISFGLFKKGYMFLIKL